MGMRQDELTGSRILLVEDEESLAVGLEYNLTNEGYVVILAADGKQAIDLFMSESFDLIIPILAGETLVGYVRVDVLLKKFTELFDQLVFSRVSLSLLIFGGAIVLILPLASQNHAGCTQQESARDAVGSFCQQDGASGSIWMEWLRGDPVDRCLDARCVVTAPL